MIIYGAVREVLSIHLNMVKEPFRQPHNNYLYLYHVNHFPGKIIPVGKLLKLLNEKV